MKNVSNFYNKKGWKSKNNVTLDSDLFEDNRSIAKDYIELEMIQSDSGLEKYAREKLFMKKDNEEIFLIEYDTILD